ncbi:MAG: paraquat-inducible protein A [Gammaproteobacteria bacterium]
MTNEPLLAERYAVESARLRMLLLAAGVLLAVGLVSPVITLEKFVLIHNTFSVLSGVVQLFQEGQYFLGMVVAGFSVLLPVLKLAVLFRLLSPAMADRRHLHRYLALMHDYGRWSMLDVFVVAVMVVAVKLGVFVEVQMRYGLYAFAAAALLIMFVTARVVRLTDRLAEDRG